MIATIKYYFRIFLECFELFVARVDGKYIDNQKVQIWYDSHWKDVQFKVYHRKGYVYYIMDEPIIDPTYYLQQ